MKACVFQPVYSWILLSNSAVTKTSSLLHFLQGDIVTSSTLLVGQVQGGRWVWTVIALYAIGKQPSANGEKLLGASDETGYNLLTAWTDSLAAGWHEGRSGYSSWQSSPMQSFLAFLKSKLDVFKTAHSQWLLQGIITAKLDSHYCICLLLSRNQTKTSALWGSERRPISRFATHRLFSILGLETWDLD